MPTASAHTPLSRRAHKIVLAQVPQALQALLDGMQDPQPQLACSTSVVRCHVQVLGTAAYTSPLHASYPDQDLESKNHLDQGDDQVVCRVKVGQTSLVTARQSSAHSPKSLIRVGEVKVIECALRTVTTVSTRRARDRGGG